MAQRQQLEFEIKALTGEVSKIRKSLKDIKEDTSKVSATQDKMATSSEKALTSLNKFARAEAAAEGINKVGGMVAKLDEGLGRVVTSAGEATAALSKLDAEGITLNSNLNQAFSDLNKGGQSVNLLLQTLTGSYEAGTQAMEKYTSAKNVLADVFEEIARLAGIPAEEIAKLQDKILNLLNLLSGGQVKRLDQVLGGTFFQDLFDLFDSGFSEEGIKRFQEFNNEAKALADTEAEEQRRSNAIAKSRREKKQATEEETKAIKENTTAKKENTMAAEQEAIAGERGGAGGEGRTGLPGFSDTPGEVIAPPGTPEETIRRIENAGTPADPLFAQRIAQQFSFGPGAPAQPVPIQAARTGRRRQLFGSRLTRGTRGIATTAGRTNFDLGFGSAPAITSNAPTPDSSLLGSSARGDRSGSFGVSDNRGGVSFGSGLDSSPAFNAQGGGGFGSGDLSGGSGLLPLGTVGGGSAAGQGGGQFTSAGAMFPGGNVPGFAGDESAQQSNRLLSAILGALTASPT